PLRKPALEVARDAEAGEDAPERSRLEEDEDELESRVAVRVVEAGRVLNLRQPTRKRGEEEQRERHRRQQDRRRREDVLERAPGDAGRHGPEPHVRSILCPSAQPAAASDTTVSTIAIEKPSASASASQPVMIRLRTHSIRYETGLTEARKRHQSTAIRFLG